MMREVSNSSVASSDSGQEYTSETWPIGAKMAFGPRAHDGAPLQERPAEWRHQLDKVARVGFTSIDPTDEWLPFWKFTSSQRDELLNEMGERGLVFSSLSMGRRSVVDAENGLRNFDTISEVIDFAASVGCSMVNIGFMQALTPAQENALWFWHREGHVDKVENRRVALDRTRQLAHHAAQRGVCLSLEMYEDTFCGSAEEAISFITELGCRNVGLNPDVGNLIRLHRPVQHWREIYEKVLPYANFWHIKNYIRDEDQNSNSYFTAPAPLETGAINYREVIELALRLGFRGPFLAEHYGGDWLGIGAQNMRYIRSVIAAEMGEALR